MLSVPRAPDAHRLLLRAILAAFPVAGLLSSGTKPWASVTFVGARHDAALSFPTAAEAIAAAAALPDMAFALRRHLVADVVATVEGARIDVSVLTIEEC